MITEEEMNNDFLEFALDLYDISSIPRKAVQTILQKVENLFEKYNSFLDQLAQNDIKDYCPVNVCGGLHVKFEENKYPLQSYLTEHLRLKTYKEKKVFQEPKEFRLGIELVKNVDNKVFVEEVLRKAVYIPLKPNLKILF